MPQPAVFAEGFTVVRHAYDQCAPYLRRYGIEQPADYSVQRIERLYLPAYAPLAQVTWNAASLLLGRSCFYQVKIGQVRLRD